MFIRPKRRVGYDLCQVGAGFRPRYGMSPSANALTPWRRCVILPDMDPTIIFPASQIPPADRAAVLNAAYVDYHVPFRVTPDQVRDMDVLYDVDLPSSLVARAGDQIVGMALLARRGARGWISAVGVIPERRRQGIARQLLAGLLTRAQDGGICQLTLEVIDANVSARQLYRALGFVAGRELLCWRFPADADALPIPKERLISVPPASLWQHFAAWHDQPPCWQREAASLHRMAAKSRSYLLMLDGAPAGYCLVNERGDAVSILDVGINPQFGPVAAGRVLLQALSAIYRGRMLSITNVPADAGLNKALAALHFLVVVRQWEMTCAISA